MNLTEKQQELYDELQDHDYIHLKAVDKRTVNALVKRGLAYIDGDKVFGTPPLDDEEDDVSDVVVQQAEKHSSEPTTDIVPSDDEKPLYARINAGNILDMKTALSDWKPRNASEAVQMKYLQYLLNNNKDAIDEACSSVLDDLEFEEGEYVDGDTGLKLAKKSGRRTKVWNRTQAVTEAEYDVAILENELSEAKATLNEAREEAGFEYEPSDKFTYAVKLT